MDPVTSSTIAHQTTKPRPAADNEAQLRKAASEFEAVFIAEMLSHTGVATPRKENGGGVGEEAFSSFLTRKYADKLAENGGFGLSERIYQALVAREG